LLSRAAFVSDRAGRQKTTYVFDLIYYQQGREKYGIYINTLYIYIYIYNKYKHIHDTCIGYIRVYTHINLYIRTCTYTQL
jgi:hypothetical protein